MSDYIEVLDETDPRSNLDGDTLIHTDMFLTPLDRAWQQGGAMRSFSLIVWMMTHRTMSGNKAVP